MPDASAAAFTDPGAAPARACRQAVFARYLNVSTGLVSQWERGEKEPVGASLKMLTLVREKGLQAVA